MAKRKAARRARPTSPKRKAKAAKRSVKRPTRKSARKARPAARPAVRRVAKKTPKKAVRRTASKPVARKQPQINRERRRLEDVVQSPPSSLDMQRRGTAARSGRVEMAEKRNDFKGMTSMTGGDPDTNAEDAYFTGDGAPGGDNPSPDMEVVDDIGKALGVEYQDNEELKPNDKVGERDKHRWELDPASAEDYRDRK